MALIKIFPEIQLLCYPLPSSGFYVPSFCVSDVLGDTKVDTSNLRFWNLNDDVHGLNLAGYTLEPQVVPFNAHIGSASGLPANNNPLAFHSLKGNSWTTVTPDYEPDASAIKWYSANGEFAARTASKLAPYQSFSLQLHTFGYDGDNSELNIVWGGGNGIFMQPGTEPFLGKFNSGNGSVEKLRDLPFQREHFSGGEPVWLHVYHIGGRMVIEAEQGGKKQQSVYTDMQESTNGTIQQKPVGDKAGYLQVFGNNVPFTMRVNEIQWPDTGNISRQIDAASEDYPSSTAQGVSLGHSAAPGANGLADLYVDGDGRNKSYTAVLNRGNSSTKYAMAGQVTPLISAVALRFPGGHPTLEGTAIDISPAVTGLTVEFADPAISPGRTGTADFNRNILRDSPVYNVDADGLPVGDAIGTIGDNWNLYVNKYHQFKLLARWVYRDTETTETWSGNRDPWTDNHLGWGLLHGGYINGVELNVPSVNEQLGQIDLRDPIIRLDKPAGLVDSRFAPADFLHAAKMQAAGGQWQELYGWEIIEDILRVSIGDEWADKLDVIFPSNHYGLFEQRFWTDPPQSTGFILPPPFGQTALDWIKQIAEIDFAVFFMAPRWGNNGPEFVPVYANYYEFLRGQTPIVLPDAQYFTDDANWAIQSASIRQNTQQDYNVVQVWGKVPGDSGGYEQYMPALPNVSAREFVVPGYDEQDPAATWERTLLKKGKNFFNGRITRVVARNIARLLSGIDPRKLTVKTRGELGISWGKKLYVQANSAFSDNDLFDDSVPDVWRIMRGSHTFRFNQQATWESNITCAPEKW